MKDSNLRNPGPKPGDIAANRMRDYIYFLVQGTGIEPVSQVFQTCAEITRLAHPAELRAFYLV